MNTLMNNQNGARSYPNFHDHTSLRLKQAASDVQKYTTMDDEADGSNKHLLPMDYAMAVTELHDNQEARLNQLQLM